MDPVGVHMRVRGALFQAEQTLREWIIQQVQVFPPEGKTIRLSDYSAFDESSAGP